MPLQGAVPVTRRLATLDPHQSRPLQSRCMDDTGYVQPAHDEILAVRGKNATDHYNGIKVWRVLADGRVTHV
jgi:sulfane dehydrogenase subunit SoxC